MDSIVYYVGDRPGGSWTFRIRDNNTGQNVDLSSYNAARVHMADSDNNIVTFPANNAYISDPATGEVTFLWPNESVFTKPGQYIMQVELIGANTIRRTSVTDILIRELGGITR